MNSGNLADNVRASEARLLNHKRKSSVSKKPRSAHSKKSKGSRSRSVKKSDKTIMESMEN